MKHNFLKNKKGKIILALGLITLLSIGSGCFSYYYTSGTIQFYTSNVESYMFKPSVYLQDSSDVNVDLSSTITNDKEFGPGAQGRISIVVDIEYVDNYPSYRISIDRTNLPTNLKFYYDKDFVSEFNEFNFIKSSDEYTHHINEDDKNYYLYWKWLEKDDADSNANDSLFMNQEIIVPIKVAVSQTNTYIDDNYYYAFSNTNSDQGQVAIVDLLQLHNGNKGWFVIYGVLDNISNYSTYRVHFGELSDNLHFYSDSNYQNEISYLEVSSNIFSTTIYWKLEEDDISILDDGLYCVIVAGNW